MPEPFQLRRLKGWRMPPNGRSVARPGRFGNPFNWQDGIEAGGGPGRGEAWAKSCAVELHAEWIDHPDRFPTMPAPPTHEEIRRELRGKDLGCFCALGEPCHRRTLLRIANG